MTDVPRARDAGSAVTGTVLSIDDSATVRQFIVAALRSRSHITVLVAETGEEGIRAARAHRPTLILLDATLPDMPGLDVLRALKDSEATRDIPVVILSGSGPAQDRQFMAAGAEQQLMKPIALGDLYSLVDRYVSPAP